MSLAYAPKGLLGVLTPQANTTVEPELAVMVPKGFAWINGRLVSDKGSIEARLVDYYATLDGALSQFANAPVGAIAVACTGASYLVGPEEEDRLVAQWSARAKAPVVTAARGVLAALAALSAKRVALVSPYTADLDRASKAYWTARGLEIVTLASAYRESEAFHPIYSLSSEAADAALAEAMGSGAEAVVMLGTGMPTLEPILDATRRGGPPVISCMLAMTWAAIRELEAAPLDADSLSAWRSGAAWGGAGRLARNVQRGV